MLIDELHPIARDLLTAFASQEFFLSNRLCQIVAERDPALCVAWATRLIEASLTETSPHAVVTETLTLVTSLIALPNENSLLRLDDLASQCWCSGSFDDSKPYLQRAVARLAWATIGMVCFVMHCSFTSERVGISADSNDGSAIKIVVQQSASAIDMTYTEANDGRLMVAADFTRLMERIP